MCYSEAKASKIVLIPLALVEFSYFCQCLCGQCFFGSGSNSCERWRGPGTPAGPNTYCCPFTTFLLDVTCPNFLLNTQNAKAIIFYRVANTGTLQNFFFCNDPYNDGGNKWCLEILEAVSEYKLSHLFC